MIKHVKLEEEGVGAADLMTFLFPSKCFHKTTKITKV